MTLADTNVLFILKTRVDLFFVMSKSCCHFLQCRSPPPPPLHLTGNQCTVPYRFADRWAYRGDRYICCIRGQIFKYLLNSVTQFSLHWTCLLIHCSAAYVWTPTNLADIGKVRLA